MQRGQQVEQRLSRQRRMCRLCSLHLTMLGDSTRNDMHVGDAVLPDTHPQSGAGMRCGDAVSPRNNTGRVLAFVEKALCCGV